MRVVVFLALVAYAIASDVQDEVSTLGSSEASYESYTSQPVIVVRMTTYYEPELVAVVVEKGVDDIPEETVLIRNYADVLGATNNEIRLCATDDSKCLDTPVTKLLVPSLFQSIGQNGFGKFFEQAKDVPWIATLGDTPKLVNPFLSPKTPELSPTLSEQANLHYLDNYKIQPVSSDVFKFIPETAMVPDYHSVFTSLDTNVGMKQSVLVSDKEPVSRGFISPINTFILPTNIQKGFAPLDKISTGGSILGGTTKTTFQQTPNYSSYLRERREVSPANDPYTTVLPGYPCLWC